MRPVAQASYLPADFAVAGVGWRSMIGCVLLPVGRSSWFEMLRAVLRNQDAAEGFVGTMA